MFSYSLCQSLPVTTALIVSLVAALCGCLALAVGWSRARAEVDRLAPFEHEVVELRAEVLRLRPPRSAVSRRTTKALSGVATVVETAVEGAQRFREGGVSGLLMSSIEDFATWASADRQAISQITSVDGTVTILFSDIEDSTRLNHELGDKEFVRLLAAHDDIVRGAVERHHGHVVKSQGDGFMTVFATPADAVHAAIDLQDRITHASAKVLRRHPIRVRIGIHVGPAIERDGDWFGRNVAMAARVASEARGGEVLVSDDVRQALREVEDVILVDAREAELKGLPGSHRLWSVAIV